MRSAAPSLSRPRAQTARSLRPGEEGCLLRLPDDLTNKVANCLTYFDANRLRSTSNGGRRIGNELERLVLERYRVRRGEDRIITSDITVFTKLKCLALLSMQLKGAHVDVILPRYACFLHWHGVHALGPPLPDTLRLLTPLTATLEQLSLEANELLGGTITSEISAFTKLTRLSLGSIGLTGPPLHETIKLLVPLAATLQVLCIADNNLVGGTITSGISAFTKLTDLNLSTMGLTGPPLHETIKLLVPLAATLEDLNLGVNFLGGTIPSEIAAFTKIRWLNLSTMGLTGPPLDETIKLLAPLAATLVSLNLDNNDLGGTITSDMAVFTNLTFLSLEFMELSGPPLHDAIQLLAPLAASLEDLYLNDNHLAGNVASDIAMFTKLTSLCLCQMGLPSDATTLPEEIRDLVNLQVLALHSNGFEGPLPQSLPRSLVSLDLGYNQFTGTIPTEWGALTNLERLDISYCQLDRPVNAEVALGGLVAMGRLTEIFDTQSGEVLRDGGGF